MDIIKDIKDHVSFLYERLSQEFVSDILLTTIDNHPPYNNMESIQQQQKTLNLNSASWHSCTSLKYSEQTSSQ